MDFIQDNNFSSIPCEDYYIKNLKINLSKYIIYNKKIYYKLSPGYYFHSFNILKIKGLNKGKVGFMIDENTIIFITNDLNNKRLKQDTFRLQTESLYLFIETDELITKNIYFTIQFKYYTGYNIEKINKKKFKLDNIINYSNKIIFSVSNYKNNIYYFQNIKLKFHKIKDLTFSYKKQIKSYHIRWDAFILYKTENIDEYFITLLNYAGNRVFIGIETDYTNIKLEINYKPMLENNKPNLKKLRNRNKYIFTFKKYCYYFYYNKKIEKDNKDLIAYYPLSIDIIDYIKLLYKK